MIVTKEVTKLGWSEKIWKRIHEAVHDECKRAKIASKFIPLYGPVSSGELTVPSDSIKPDARQALTVDEAATTPLIELFVEFILTPQQVDREEELTTAVTLATRAANLLSQAEDIVLFQGQSAINGQNPHPLFKEGKVHVRSGPAGEGLLNAANTKIQVVPVQPLEQPGPQRRYGENTFGAVSEAYSRLQSGKGLAQAHYGPYALVLHHDPFADTLAPLPTTLIMPADRIKPLVTWTNPKMKVAEFYGTGTLPDCRGLLVSLGGNTMDLVVGVDATTEYLTQDDEGQYRFRVFERFALRLKDPSAVMRLEFQPVRGMD